MSFLFFLYKTITVFAIFSMILHHIRNIRLYKFDIHEYIDECHYKRFIKNSTKYKIRHLLFYTIGMFLPFYQILIIWYTCYELTYPVDIVDKK